MKNEQIFNSIQNLFSNKNPEVVWEKAAEIVSRISTTYDLSDVHRIFCDTVDLFHGNYPGYAPVKTPFHDLQHTLDVFLCSVRLMHGVHISGTTFEDQDITLILIASLMHDVGFAQKRGTEVGTGAQFMQIHVERSIEFTQDYIKDQHFPSGWIAPLGAIIRSTDLDFPFSQIDFLNERTRLLGQIVSTADLLGQMADRTYVEKLLYLYEEFKEAKFNGYQSLPDLMRQTQGFFEIVQQRLEIDHDRIYEKLKNHFTGWFGVERNFYMEAIEKNIAYLSRLNLLEEEKHHSMLRRGGIVNKLRRGDIK